MAAVQELSVVTLVERKRPAGERTRRGYVVREDDRGTRVKPVSMRLRRRVPNR
ncbi:MAG: hypothetical protein INR72_16315 [Williamsia herbipolensis]|nr:hypothetical protein [Williamsia herbipolensis]